MSASEEPQSSDDPEPPPKQGWKHAHAGLQYGATLVLFTALGYGLDRRLDWEPLFTITGTFLGFGLGLYGLIRKLQ